MRIAAAQYNPTVGDLRGNSERLLAAAANAKEQGAHLLVTPELALTGYPPRDLCDRPGFIHDAVKVLANVVEHAPMPMLVGGIVSAGSDPFTVESRISNAAVLIEKNQVRACHRKVLLPNYDVFDEVRYFTPGTGPTVARVQDVTLGITICEDMWNDKDYWRRPRYERDPVAEVVKAGAELLVNLSASPYDRNKPDERLKMLQALARRYKCPLLYVNQVGGNDSLLFDGRSMGLAATGEVTLRAAAFREVLAMATLDTGVWRGDFAADPECWEEDVTEALCLGLRDYMRKCGFNTVVLGLSGGIDSALVAALAVRALGASRVTGVAMPSRYSSQGSIDDAQQLADRLGIRMDVVPIEPMFQSYLAALERPFADRPADITEENLQARIRGTLLMAYSNKFGALLLTTGNKSEVSVGYCTLYGDMNGGLAPISDLYKTEVYAVARYLNRHADTPVIPVSTLTKAPSAELRPNQTDQDSLPPYDVLDGILRGYVDNNDSPEQIVAHGFPQAVVQRVMTLVDRSEHKRRQMAPGLRISHKAFGEGRRFPVAQRYLP